MPLKASVSLWSADLLNLEREIRCHTVPRLRAAGVDIVVPGSLIFNGDCQATSRWLRAV